MSSSLAEQGLKIQPEASGLVYVPMVQQVGLYAADHVWHAWNNLHGLLGAIACSADQMQHSRLAGCGAACTHLRVSPAQEGRRCYCTPIGPLIPHPSFPAITTSQEVDDDAFEANEALLERLLAVDDVDAVYTTVAGLE